MATIHHQPHHSPPYTAARRLRRHSLDSAVSSSASSSSPSSFSVSLRHSPIHLITLSHPTTTATTTTNASAAATTAATTTADTAYSLEVLERHLAAGDFRQADEETRHLLIVLAGESAVKRGYVFFSEVQFIPKNELKSIDELWKKFSNNRFGYSVQKKIWLKLDKDFTKFFIKVGWMKKLDTEIEQFNYRAFPNEFIWEMNNNNNNNNNNNDGDNNKSNVPPEGHLPLTNALRGTQLLSCILNHPAFYDEDEESDKREVEDEDEDDDNGVIDETAKKMKSRFASFRDKLFKTSYKF